jgi:mono/diheme cytochrome c family protein
MAAQDTSARLLEIQPVSRPDPRQEPAHQARGSTNSTPLGSPGIRPLTKAPVRLAAIVIGLLSVTLAPSVRAAPDQPGTDQIARGKYLADAGDCMACHTNPGGEAFAGGRMMETPFGPLSTPNITPDKATGIGDWTDDQFYRTLHNGVGRNGEYLYPAMPYPWYTKVTRDDALAIKAYLFSLNPVNAPRKPSKLAFPFNIRTGLLAWNQAFFHEGTFQPDPAKSTEVNRGAYLVQGLGHCGECHNGNGLLGNGGIAKPLQGSALQGWYAPNITSDVHEGVGKYSDDQLVSYLKTGQAQGMGAASGPMAETIHDSLSKLSDADLHAMVAYLKSTQPETSYTPTQKSAFTGPQPAGRDVYLNNCVSCHQSNGQGIPGSVASLVGNGAVLAGGPQDVIRTILGGIEAKGTEAPMPAIGTGMSDQDIADVTNYVRQSWGNQAPPTAGPGMAGNLRASTVTALYGPPAGECPKITPQAIAAAVSDRSTGIADSLRAMTPANVLQTVEQILPKIKASAPGLPQADIVNGLTLAYCPIIRQDTRLPEQQKITQLDGFSERVYSELKTNGKE